MYRNLYQKTKIQLVSEKLTVSKLIKQKTEVLNHNSCFFRAECLSIMIYECEM